MTGKYKFLRTMDGITAFACVTLESLPYDHSQITWDDSVNQLKSCHGAAAVAGVNLALLEREQRGGTPQWIRITDLQETVSDTKSDAVKCAAALACWNAWGYPMKDVI